MATRDELVAALMERYSQAKRAEKAAILAEFVALTGYHRKHAARLLRGGGPAARIGRRRVPGADSTMTPFGRP